MSTIELPRLGAASRLLALRAQSARRAAGQAVGQIVGNGARSVRHAAALGAQRARHAAARMARALEAAALPPVCCLCGAAGQPPALDLCDVCATFLPVLDDGSIPASGGTVLRTLFLFKYENPVDELIRGLKFRGERVHARVLGQLMARARRARGGRMPECLVPIPLHLTRFRERGFNQAHEIARYAGASLGIRVDSSVLVRKLATKEQSGLALEERRRNVRGAFEVARRVPRGGIAVVDDVVTTGSTAWAAVEALCEAGAVRDEVEVWAVARVLPSHPARGAPGPIG